jgi:hypothetical protein
MTPQILRIALLIVLLQITTACAVGTTHIRVDHTPFVGESSAKPGDLVVRTFRDLRVEDHRPYIGAKRNGYGMVLGHVAVPEGESLEGILSQYFVEALQGAGYRAWLAETGASMPDDFHPVAFVDGDIVTFWLDMYMATWHSIAIDFRLSDLSDQVLWEDHFVGDESNVLWIGIKSEFEKVIRQALDEALDQAKAEFGSADFDAQVQVAADLARAQTRIEEAAAGDDGAAAGDDGAAPGDDEALDAVSVPPPTVGPIP